MFQQSQGGSSVSSVTHKDYIKNMLLQKFNKKHVTNAQDFQTQQLINNEVINFIKSEKLNRDNLKLLEQRIEQRLSNKTILG